VHQRVRMWWFSALAAIKRPEPTEADEAEHFAQQQQYREEEAEAQLGTDNAEADAETRATAIVPALPEAVRA